MILTRNTEHKHLLCMKIILIFADPQNKMYDEENGLNVNLLGKVREPSLSALVQNTMQQAKQHKSEKGYLMTIIGGYINDLSNQQSDTAKAIKYAAENTKAINTLIVVTGSCPSKEQSSDPSNSQKMEMPLYVRGTKFT